MKSKIKRLLTTITISALTILGVQAVSASSYDYERQDSLEASETVTAEAAYSNDYSDLDYQSPNDEATFVVLLDAAVINDDIYDLAERINADPVELISRHTQTNSHGVRFIEVKTHDTWTLEFEDDDGYVWDILKLADDNDVYPESLRDSVVGSFGAARFSPFENVIQKNPPQARALIGRTRTGITQVTDQNATAYVATGNKTASGKDPAVGMAAMHINVTTKTNPTTAEILKLGTPIYFGTPNKREYINFNGYSRDSLVVEDRGNPSNRTKYWIDIFFGDATTANRTAALNYGVKTQAFFYWNY